ALDRSAIARPLGPGRNVPTHRWPAQAFENGGRGPSRAGLPAVGCWRARPTPAPGRDGWVAGPEGPAPGPDAPQAADGGGGPLRRAVRATGAFIFVITPRSAGSPECTDEVAHAVEDGKRLAPLLLGDVDAALLPDAIAACQWIDVREAVDRSKAIDALVEALG